MTDLVERQMTLAEFLDWDDGTDTRYELIDGRPVAMAPSSANHGAIGVNLAGRRGRGAVALNRGP